MDAALNLSSTMGNSFSKFSAKCTITIRREVYISNVEHHDIHMSCEEHLAYWWVVSLCSPQHQIRTVSENQLIFAHFFFKHLAHVISVKLLNPKVWQAGTNNQVRLRKNL